MSPLLRARALVYRFGDVCALNGIDLEAAEGQSIGLLGSNGSGRTTLLQILATLRKPDAGSLEIAGVDAVRSPFLARRHVMYVGPELPASAGLRVHEYVEFVREARQRRDARSAMTTDAALQRSGLASHASVDALSTGMRRRLALAAALVAAPRLLLLDDPFAALDQDVRSRFLEWMREARATGTTMIAAVNGGADADALCDVVLRLDQGRIVSAPVSIAPQLNLLGAPALSTGGL